MRVVIFCHSLISDWNHGNAHFLRGISNELLARGHDVHVWEPSDSWSLQNLLTTEGESSLREFAAAYPNLRSKRYDLGTLDLSRALHGADLILVHEWNDPSVVQRIGDYRKRSQGSTLLFHDTHHRSVTDPEAMSRYDLSGYDGVLAFGASVAEVYRNYGWGRRVWVWHEAADTQTFFPQKGECDGDLVWIGNWGDDERAAELREFLIDPVRDLGLRARIHGVRYPDSAKADLNDAGIEYAGWIANFKARQVFSHYRFTVHVPRRPYATALPGVPTIRIFEALACGIPLISAPWSDCEGLFTPGKDFIFVTNGKQMRDMMRAFLAEPEFARSLAQHGRGAILARHTCAHRVNELLAIESEISQTSHATLGEYV